MDLEPDDDQVALRDELRRFLGDRVTPEARREIADLPGAVDRGLVKELAGLGVFALTVPEADGGVGLGLAEAAIVFEELGRAAVPGPLIGTFLAAALSGDLPGSPAGLAAGAAAGEKVVGLVPGPSPRWVEHLDGLDALIVLGAGEGAGGRVTVVEPAPSGGQAHERPLDLLTPVTAVDTLPAGVAVGGEDLAAEMRRTASLLAAALQVGLAQGALEMAVVYAGERHQFGRAIGSFQAVKHLLADAQAAVEVARAGVHAAAVAGDEAGVAGDVAGDVAGAGGALDRGAPGHDLDLAVDSARVVASRAAHRSTTTCVQVHGGMGYTWELDAHLFLKRAMVLDQAPGRVEEAHGRLAAGLGDGGVDAAGGGR